MADAARRGTPSTPATSRRQWSATSSRQPERRWSVRACALSGPLRLRERLVGILELAVNLFSGEPAEPPSQDFLMRNAMDSREIAVGWWPGNAAYPRAAFYAYAHPAPAGLRRRRRLARSLEPKLGEFVLDWDAVLATPDPHATALSFARPVARHACPVCDWDQALASGLEGQPPPVN